jgi:hypothetical protein
LVLKFTSSLTWKLVDPSLQPSYGGATDSDIVDHHKDTSMKEEKKGGIYTKPSGAMHKQRERKKGTTHAL